MCASCCCGAVKPAGTTTTAVEKATTTSKLENIEHAGVRIVAVVPATMAPPKSGHNDGFVHCSAAVHCRALMVSSVGWMSFLLVFWCVFKLLRVNAVIKGKRVVIETRLSTRHHCRQGCLQCARGLGRVLRRSVRVVEHVVREQGAEETRDKLCSCSTGTQRRSFSTAPIAGRWRRLAWQPRTTSPAPLAAPRSRSLPQSVKICGRKSRRPSTAGFSL